MEGLAIGATGLGIKVVESTIEALRFIHAVVVDFRHYGEQTQSVKTKIIAELSRLNSLQSYLQSTTTTSPGGEKTTEIAKLRPSTQSAVFNLLQELDISFASFSGYINEHRMEVFQTAAGYSKTTALTGTTVDQRLAFRARDAKSVQESAPKADKVLWGIFTIKKVIKLVDEVKEWNDTLMHVLLCDLVFGKRHDAPMSSNSSSTLTQFGKDATLSAGLKLRALVDSPSAKGSSTMIDNTATLDVVDDANHIGILRKSNNNGVLSEVHIYFEKKPYELRRRSTEPSEVVKTRVERLGRLLGLAHSQDNEEEGEIFDTGFHTLRCVCVVRLPLPETAYAFAFRLPESTFPKSKCPVSLLQAIESKTLDRPTLGDRFAMARRLVQTVFQLHSVGWLHKSIRSENILFGFRKVQGTETLEIDYSRPYLVGFEFSREERDRSTTEQDGRLDRNIYRHPDRQGPPEERFNALHDIYSLGVVLLEIGLWRMALYFEGTGGYDDATPEKIMETLIEHSRRRLPHYMGVEYTESVVACLEGKSLLAVEEVQTNSMEAAEKGDSIADVGLGLTDAQRLELNLALLEKVLNPLQHVMR